MLSSSLSSSSSSTLLETPKCAVTPTNTLALEQNNMRNTYDSTDTDTWANRPHRKLKHQTA